MKAKPYKNHESLGLVECSPEEATHLLLHMPGPLPNRMLEVITKGTRKGTPCWTWNGSVDKPTLKPSILTWGTPHVTDEELAEIQRTKQYPADVRCHSWVSEGLVLFLDDSTHIHKGKTLPLLDVE